MPNPSVILNELDGAIGTLPAGARAMAVIGTAFSGPVATPAAHAKRKAILDTFGGGAAPESAAYHIEGKRLPVVFVRAAAAVAATNDTIDTSAVAGSVTVTITAATLANDDYELVWEAINGGTVGTAGITFRYSYDGGRSWAPETALGTALVFAFPGAGGISFDFDTGETVLAGDRVTLRTYGPTVDATSLGAAIDALAASTLEWEIVHFADPITATTFATIETKFAALAAAGKERAWVGNFRMPELGETEAEYLTAFSSAFSSLASIHGELCFGACELTSALTNRRAMRPVSYVIASEEASVSEEINIADPNRGALKGVTIRDENGNAKHHDELISPGADDARASTLRTWNEFQGVYPTRPRLFSPAGSDFEIMPHRRVMNLAKKVLRAYLARRLSRPIRVNKTTGFILEAEALQIEAGARAVLRAALGAQPKASDWSFTVSREDNLLSTKTMTGQARVTPLAYPDTIEVDVGYQNPALQVVAV